MRREQPGGECADRIFCGSVKRRKPVESASARGIREQRCKLGGSMRMIKFVSVCVTTHVTRNQLRVQNDLYKIDFGDMPSELQFCHPILLPSSSRTCSRCSGAPTSARAPMQIPNTQDRSSSANTSQDHGLLVAPSSLQTAYHLFPTLAGSFLIAARSFLISDLT